MIAAPGTVKKIWSEEDLQALPEDGYIHEVVSGELILRPKDNFQHERICTRLLVALDTFNCAHQLGVVLGSSAGFWMFNRNCRAPDISFIPKQRLAKLGFSPTAETFFPGAPDLAVEVLAPSNTRAEIDARLKDFFASGTEIAWIIDPDTGSAEVCHSPTQRRLTGPGGELDGEHLLPGFRYPIADLFKDWGWE